MSHILATLALATEIYANFCFEQAFNRKLHLVFWTAAIAFTIFVYAYGYITSPWLVWAPAFALNCAFMFGAYASAVGLAIRELRRV